MLLHLADALYRWAGANPFWRVGHGRVVSSLDTVVGGEYTPGNPFGYLGRKRLPCGKYNVYPVVFT